MSVFGERLRGMNLELYSDNTGAERATAKGGSRAWDHSCIAHCIWFVIFIHMLFSHVFLRSSRSKALQLQMGLWISRVPSKDNISDDPSRECYSLLKKLNAVWVAPKLCDIFKQPQSCCSLSMASDALHAEAASAVPNVQHSNRHVR